MDDMKKGMCSLRLEKMSKVYNKKNGEIDPTMVRATFSILDFNESGNKQIVPKKVALEGKDTLKYKPLVCNYIPTTDYDNPNDDFTDHCEQTIILRNGEEYVGSTTVPIGVCEDVDVGIVTDDYGNEVECIVADFLLWLYRFPNEVSLINSFYENGETLYTSCEHYYKSDEFDENGNEIISKITFDGHCLLGRGVEPAYASSKLLAFNESWNKAVNNMRIKNKSTNNKEVQKLEKKNIMFEMLKSNNAISSGSLRWRIYDALEQVMIAQEFNNMYLSDFDIYPIEGYFTYDTWTEENGYKLYKVTYTVDENDVVSIDYEGKQEVQYKSELVEVQKSLNAKNVEIKTLTDKIEELEKSLNTKETELTNLIENNGSIQTKLNESNELVISLNSKVKDLEGEIETMKPIVDSYNKAEFEKSLNKAKEIYKEKFENIGALDVFNSDEIQELIKKSINSTTDEYKSMLNQLIVDNVKTTVKVENDGEPMVKSINSIVEGKGLKNLIPNDIDIYEEMCGIKVD